MAAEACDIVGIEVDRAVPIRRLAGYDDCGRLATAPFQNQLRRQFESRHDEFRIDAAFKAVARVGNHAEPSTRARRADGTEVSGIDEDIDGRLRAARVL